MSLLQILNEILPTLVPVETGVFSDPPPDRYLVITPLTDTFDLHADNQPNAEVQEARLCLFVKGNYVALKNQIVKALLRADVTITDRRFISHDDTTGHNQYAIDVAKEFDFETEDENTWQQLASINSTTP